MGLFGKHKKMPMLDTGKVDGMARNGNELRLLLTDPIPWNDGSLPEKDHLLQLQEKINNYIAFYESEQYKSIYPGLAPDSAVIEIHFNGGVTENCNKFLDAVNSQLKTSGMTVETQIS
jgi:hypothetical protein